MATDIAKIVTTLVKKYKTKNVWELAKCLKINIVFREMKPFTKGIFIHHIKAKQIVINSLLDETSQKIVLAHELGHAILHSNNAVYFIREKTLFPTGRYEIQANKFAAELLINETDREVFLEHGSIMAAKILGVPEELLFYKFKK